MDLTNLNEEERQNEERNINWQKTELAITDAINKLTRENERLPTQIEIAKEAGVDRRTVYMHLKQFRIARRTYEEIEKLEMIGPKILGKMGEKAMNGDLKATKLWMFLMALMEKKKGLE